ncbi:MAG: hypothetical protein SGPRY_007148, partial [Prymnesium sp.]
MGAQATGTGKLWAESPADFLRILATLPKATSLKSRDLARPYQNRQASDEAMLSLLPLTLSLQPPLAVGHGRAASAVSYAHTLVKLRAASEAQRAVISSSRSSGPSMVASDSELSLAQYRTAMFEKLYSEIAGTGVNVRYSSQPDSEPPVTEEILPISDSEVFAVQRKWADAIAAISKSYLEEGDYVATAAEAAGELYGYGHGNVLFKPTKAAEQQFRPTGEDAMSYFVGAGEVENGIEEDSGFAINGGKGWAKVEFENHNVQTEGHVAFAMGNYYFTCANTGSKTKVKYTFGYKRSEDGKLRIFLHHSSVPYSEPVVIEEEDVKTVSEEEVVEAQQKWADSIAAISKAYLEKGDYVQAAADAAGELYGYGHGNVLFKPTKAAEQQFRPTGEDAMSYFVGAGAVENGIKEDSGFAINGGKGWAKVKFDNHAIDLNGNSAIAMGNYYFTCATTGETTKVEYTFGYKKNDDDKVRIYLHHSSVPYSVGPSGSQPVTEEEVRMVQSEWASAIKRISALHKEGGDYMTAAADAAGQLYAYGHSNVLFKPTKAAEYQFRPTPEEAMSYFVGGQAVEGGYDEDAGFAINGGKGWADCVYDNHQIALKGDIGIAMGNYYFTCATTGSETKVEYTFGYTRCDDGKVRIFLHHSSVPFAAPGPQPVTEEEVLEVQSKWASAIKRISALHKEGGDYMTAAADAAGELYAYGHSNVLFKPTKAAEYQFRPTPEEAMSYFVGGQAVEGGYDEDAGFAINGGKGWADCVYDNHQVEIKEGVGIAMGNYYFTCATTGSKTKVEYT